MIQNSRRDFLKKTSIVTLAGLTASMVPSGFNRLHAEMLHSTVFELPPLPYGYDALEPHIDKQTMEIHHTRHHKGYVDNLNKALAEKHNTDTMDKILSGVSKLGDAIRNNAGGHWNHSFFWKLMKPNGGGEPTGAVAEVINSSFGNFEAMKKAFNDAAARRFGSGWAWLIVNKDKKLEVVSTPNQDNPLMDIAETKGTPVIGIDVWEHAYYLKYQNKRGDYVQAWWNLMNWEEVNKNFADASK